MIVAAVVAFQVATYTLPPVTLPRDVSEESAEIVWYPITGSTLDDLRAQMRLAGPLDDQGVHAGMTRNATYWHVQFGESGGACYVSRVEVTVYDTVTLPLWTPSPRADPAVVAEWSRFVTMLGRHEAGHRSIAIDGAGEIARALAALPSRSTCPDLLVATNAQGQAILASTQARQRQYDADTKHGLRRGTGLEEDVGPPRRGWPPVSVVLVAVILAGIVVWRGAHWRSG